VSLILDEHRLYLSDPVRIDAFRRAIHEAVGPGDVVLDLASGTGVLGMIACEAGASRVYAIEATSLVEVARAVAAANGFAERIVTIRDLSTHAVLPEPVDAIVCDQIGHFGFEAGVVEYGVDVRDRWLKPGGIMVPARIDIAVAPVECPELHDQVEYWQQRPAGFDYSPARDWALHTGYPFMLEAGMLLGAAAIGHSLEMASVSAAPFAFATRLPVERPGVLHGIGGWFCALLSPSVTLSNAPTAPARLKRRNAFLPIDRPIAVVPGDEVRLNLHVIPPDTVTWTVEVWRGAERLGRSRQSTANGMLIARDELRRMDPRFVPTLTERGKARQSVLAFCDGRPLADIERAVFERHHGLFTSLDQASVFVAEVVTRYAK
jgi:16S rRNA G966 N2-methylase RsmD